MRMLRHYDALGPLRPARVDAVTGYRSYEACHLSRLSRIVALKDPGFTLAQVQAFLDEEVSAGELCGMLRLRQAELQSQIAAGNGAARQTMSTRSGRPSLTSRAELAGQVGGDRS
jgi:DNA-binding transcriptional MerR regulator